MSGKYPPFGVVTLLPESPDRNLMHLVKARRNRASFHLPGYVSTVCGLSGLVGSSYSLPVVEEMIAGRPVVRAMAGSCPWCLARTDK